MKGKVLRKAIEYVNRAGESEGWMIFDTKDGLQLQRIDEQGVFDGDGSALVFVEKLAEAGSSLHKLALQIVDGRQG